MNPTTEAISYFKQKDDYGRLFQLFAKKIENLGYIGGVVVLENPTTSERRTIERWLKSKKTAVGKGEIKVSLKEFDEGFNGKRFEGADFYRVVEGVVGRKLISNKFRREVEEANRIDFFTNFTQIYLNDNVSLIVDKIIHKQPGTSSFSVAYNQGNFNEIDFVMKGISLLPYKIPKRLPIFADEATGNPHAYDNESKLLNALQIIRCSQKNIPYENLQGVEEQTELLFDFGILKDDLTNFVTVNGLLAEIEGEVLKSWHYSNLENMVRNVTLRELMRIDALYPFQRKKVFVVENSGVYSSILDGIGQYEIVPIICTHGQFRLSSLITIQKLVAAGCTIYYSGDFDPEGISMAYRLKKKFGKQIQYWRYTVSDYKETISSVDISERLKMLQSIDDEYLRETIEAMVSEKKAGYQEKLIPKMLADMRGELIN